MTRFPEYLGMSYEQASCEAERLIGRYGWFASWDRLGELRSIIKRESDERSALIAARDALDRLAVPRPLQEA